MRGHPSLGIIFLPLEQMMRDKLYKSLDEFSQQNLMRSWTTHLKAPPKNYFPITTFEDPLPSQKTVETKHITMKIKPGIDQNYFFFWHVTHLTMIDWTNTDGFKNLP
jgi:hypothetical protein